MKKLRSVWLCIGVSLIPCGCGPLQRPMPVRFNDESQQTVDASWDRAFTPVDRLNRQALLDGLISAQAYQVGVDTLEFRSQKQCSAGLVIMEIHFDRLRPDEDRFSVLVINAGTTIRNEHYTRQDVEQSCAALGELSQLENRSKNGPPLNSDESTRLIELRERAAAWQFTIPEPKTD